MTAPKSLCMSEKLCTKGSGESDALRRASHSADICAFVASSIAAMDARASSGVCKTNLRRGVSMVKVCIPRATVAYAAISIRSMDLGCGIQRRANAPDLPGGNARGPIPPAAAHECQQLSHLVVGEPPGKSRHPQGRGRGGGSRQCAAGEHQANQGIRIVGEHRGIAGNLWKHLRAAFAAGSMAGGAIVVVHLGTAAAFVAFGEGGRRGGGRGKFWRNRRGG